MTRGIIQQSTETKFDTITPLCYYAVMNMIRTTISLREDIYDQMRLLAATKRTSLSKVINHKLIGHQTSGSDEDIEKKVKETLDFFRELSANTPKIDSVTAIREMREERLNQLTSR